MRTSITNPRSFAPSLKMSSSADSNTFICFLKDRKSTRLNSSHGYISYAVFCLKKKKTQNYPTSLIILDLYADSVSVHHAICGPVSSTYNSHTRPKRKLHSTNPTRA